MANPRQARIAAERSLNAETRLLDLVLPAGESLGFAGGQYVIVNTEIPLPGGRIAKRAYSILSRDREQSRFQIAVKKVGEGPGSNHMHQLQIGSDVLFSGPWGQFVPDESAAGSTLVLATDTGITAALGLVQGEKFKSRASQARVVWLVESRGYFIPEAFVRDVCASAGLDFKLEGIAPANHPSRPGEGAGILERVLQDAPPQNVFLSGDGALLYPFKERLLALGVGEGRIKIECFFNNPFKKIGA